MFDRLLDMADPYIAEAIFTIIATYFGWVFTHIFKTKESQASLHSALETGVDLATDFIATAASSSVGGTDRLVGAAADEAVSMVVDYVQQSVPGSVKFLKPGINHLRKMAMAKINFRLAELGKL